MSTPATVPAELAELDQWVVWRFIKRRGKRDKVPFDPCTGRPASSTNPTTWASYTKACAAARRYSGIGFVFSECDPFIGIDLDDCRNPETGEIAPAALRIVRALNSYTEVSPSGKGLKTWVRATLPGSVGHSAYPGESFCVEMYAHGRYFTSTGRHLEGTPHTVNEAQSAVDALYATMRPPAPKVTPRPATRRPVTHNGLSPIEQFNREHTVTELARQYGAEAVPGGLTCPCGVPHTHSVTLFISRETGRLFSYSPRCKWYTARGWDAFGLFALVEHGGDVKAAVASLRPEKPERPEEPPHPAEAPHTTTTPAQRAAEAARKRQARAQDTAERLAEARKTLETGTLTARARAVLAALIDECERSGSYACRPSNAALAERLSLSERTVQRGVAELETAGIGQRSGGVNFGPRAQTAVWAFSAPDAHRVTGCGDEPNECVTLVGIASDLESSDKQLVRGGAPPAEVAPAELPYALALAAELSGPVPELEALNEGELRAWIEQAERQLAPPDDDALHGPDGAIAYPDGAAYLPTAAAQAWWEALPKTPRPVPEVATLPEPTPAPARRKVEPADADLRSRYYGLTGMARKARAAGNARQASALEWQAAELLTRCERRFVDEPAPKVATGARAAPAHKRSSKPAQSVLFGP